MCRPRWLYPIASWPPGSQQENKESGLCLQVHMPSLGLQVDDVFRVATGLVLAWYMSTTRLSPKGDTCRPHCNPWPALLAGDVN